MSKTARCIFVLAIAVFSFGCHALRRNLVFDVALENMGSRAILEDVTIEFPGYSHNFGNMGSRPGAGARESLFTGKLPSTAHVTWRFRDDRPYMPDHETTVTIPPYPKLQRGDYVELWFELDGEQVTAHFKIWVRSPGKGSIDFKWH